MPSAYQLGAEVRERIMASIRAGGYAHVAAQAWGVPARQWRRWLRRGRRHPQREPYGSLYHGVQQAKAQARLMAELGALQKDPRFWLKHGPGKDPEDGPGWAAPARARARLPAGVSIEHAALRKFFDALRASLEPAVFEPLEQQTAEIFARGRKR